MVHAPIEEGSIPSPATNMGVNVPRQATDPCKVRVAGSIPVASTIFAVAPVPRDDRPIKWGDGTGEMPKGVKAPKIKGFVI